jgi:hypothetical protein
MRASPRLILYASLAIVLACSTRGSAQDAARPGAEPLAPSQPVYHLTSEDAKRRALASSERLGLAKLGVPEEREAIAAALADYPGGAGSSSPASPKHSTACSRPGTSRPPCGFRWATPSDSAG